MQNKPNPAHQPPYIPTETEIKRMTAEIRSKWTPKEELERRVVKGGLPVFVQRVAVPMMLESAVA